MSQIDRSSKENRKITYVHPYAKHMSQGWKVFFGHAIEAMREPRARPSKVSGTTLARYIMSMSECDARTVERYSDE